MHYDIYQDSTGQHRWRLKAKNGRIVADSGEGYAKRSGAVRAARRCWSLNQSYFFDIRGEGIVPQREFAKGTA